MEDFNEFTLLIVDDEELLRNALAFDFKRKGFTVLTAKNGVEAFQIVVSQKVHLVLSDIRMPEGDGMSMLENIRKHHPKTPIVIFITGFADVNESDCIKQGATKIFSKPFDRKVLMSAVLDVLGLSA